MAIQSVSACATPNGVVARATCHAVGAFATKDGIVALTTVDDVVAGLAVNRVVTSACVQAMRIAAVVNRVSTRARAERFEFADDIGHPVHHTGACHQIQGHVGCDGAVAQAVTACTTHQGQCAVACAGIPVGNDIVAIA